MYTQTTALLALAIGGSQTASTSKDRHARYCEYIRESLIGALERYDSHAGDFDTRS